MTRCKVVAGCPHEKGKVRTVQTPPLSPSADPKFQPLRGACKWAQFTSQGMMSHVTKTQTGTSPARCQSCVFVTFVATNGDPHAHAHRWGFALQL
jgi:hypothetical protein